MNHFKRESIINVVPYLFLVIFGMVGAFFVGRFKADIIPGFVRFPNCAASLESPDKKYTVINSDDEGKSPVHRLFLLDGKGISTKLYEYGRNVDVAWSPSGHRLLVNDHAGSDWTKPMIFTIGADGVTSLDVEGEFQKKAPAEDEKFNDYNLYHHHYMEGVRWLNNDELEIRLYGHGGAGSPGSSFSAKYYYRIGGEFRKK